MTKDELLKAWTAKDSRFWIRHVQSLIKRFCFDAQPDVVHPVCDPAEWLGPLTIEVAERVRKTRPETDYDENMAAAAILAVILATWSGRISHAKAHDPNRPVKLRREALRRNRHIALAIFDAVHDETQDAKYFEQPWEYPMAKGATDGSFV